MALIIFSFFTSFSLVLLRARSARTSIHDNYLNEENSYAHLQSEMKNTTFQVSSNFNCLQNTSENHKVENDLGFVEDYRLDNLQGCICETSAMPGAINKV